MVFTIKTTSKIHWQDCCPDISHWYIILCHISHVYSKISSHISYIYIFIIPHCWQNIFQISREII
jgi:hypothetical protein